MNLLEVIIDIRNLNDGDEIDAFVKNTEFIVHTSIAKAASLAKDLTRCHLITDNRNALEWAVRHGIGVSVYLGEGIIPSDFKEALYCIESIKDMSDRNLNRMYERHANIPWEILETERCILREITLEDVDRLYEIYSDEETRLYIEDLYENKDDEIEFTRNYINNQYRFYEYGLWVVVLKETGEIIGRAGVFDREDQEQRELGFMFERKQWGKGIAFEVLCGILTYAKEELGLDDILVHTLNENIRAKRLIEKLGFTYQEKNEIDGKIYDQYRIVL